MRILLVGAGGVGGAFTAIAARRDFFETIVVADYDPARAEKAAATDDRYVAAQCRRVRRRLGHRPVPRAPDHPRDERRRPGLQHAGLRGRVRGRGRLPRHGDVPVEAAPGRAVREAGREARRRAVRPGRPSGSRRTAGAGRHRRRARSVRRVRAVRRRPPVLRDRRARHPRRRQPRGHRRRRQRDLRAVVLDVDHDRGVPQPAGDLARTATGTRRRRSASRRSSTSPRASARSSASTSSTRRSSSCRAGSTASGRRSSTGSATSSSTSSRCCTRSASTAPTRCASRGSRSRRVTSWPPCCPTRRPSARG